MKIRSHAASLLFVLVLAIGLPPVVLVLADGPTTATATSSKPAPGSKPTATAASGPSEKDFLTVMKDKCVRCHAQCKTVDSLKKAKWLVPGDPDKSPVYTVIGKTKGPGNYHDLTADETAIVRSFIKSMTAAPVASMPTNSLDQCWAAYNKGQYSNAAGGFKKLQEKHGLAAALGVAECLKMEGKYTEAIEALNSVAEQGAGDAAWQVAMSELMYIVGKYDDSLAHAAKAHELKADWAPAVFAHGQALETLGKKDEAIAVYKNIDAVLKDDIYRRDARSMVAVGRIMDRHTILSGQRASGQASNILQNYFQEAYKLDKSYWPAHVAAGQFLLQNFRPQQAMAEFQQADKINAKVTDVGVGIGTFNLQTWQFEGCLKNVDEILAINPNCAEAHLLRAACMMQWRKFETVDESLQKVLAVNPNSFEALSMQAALYIRQGTPDKATPIIDKVLKLNPRCPILYSTIGDWLVAGRQFDQAEGYYKKAIELTPELADAYANLGMLYMQTGDEQKALEPLSKAISINDFREDVVNYLNQVKELVDPEKYLVRESDHFIVKVSAQYDRVMLDEVSEYMESIYPEITRDYGYELPYKTLIEILPTHAQFSVRITGKGWVPTVGACTGKMIALSAPTKDRAGSSGTLNWAVVLRHEYTHAVTLGATENRIPHWLTEAFAVFQQPDKRAYRYIQDLVQATRTSRLFSVKDLDWGFIRPKTMMDRELAYCQSEWMLQYIIVKYGYDPTVINMIKAFHDGKTQAQVFEQVLKTTEDQFDKDFRAWAKEQITEWRFDPEPPPDLNKAAQAAASQPGDAKAQAIHAVALLNGGQFKPAQDAAQKALKIEPDNTKALAVLAYCQMYSQKFDDAIKTARHLEDLDHTSVHSARIMAQCYVERRSWVEAIAALELFKQRQPLDQYSYNELARIYTALGQPTKALPNLLEMHKLTMNDAQWARRIADIYRAGGMDKDALEFYHQVTYINPYEVTTYEAMAALYLKARDYDHAVTSADKLTLLDPDSADAWFKDSAVLYQSGSARKDVPQLILSLERARKAVSLDEENGAKDFIPQVEKEIVELGGKVPPPATGPATKEAKETTTTTTVERGE